MSYDQFIADLSSLLIQFKANLIAFTPKIVFALAIILVGILVAKLFQTIVNRSINRLDRFISTRKFKSRLKKIRFDKSAKLIAKIVYWIVLVFFITAATEILGLPIITTWLSGLVHYLPNILVAVIIIFLGIIGSRLLGDIISSASSTAGIQYSGILGKITQYIIILLTILIAVDQVGIDITILTHVIDILLAALLFGAALAFGLGARTEVSNILASYYLQNQYREGQIVKIENTEGKIIQISSTSVMFETSAGQVSVPAKHFSENVSTLVKREG